MSWYNKTDSMSEPLAPLYPQAIILPVLGFPSWILCIAPMVWHFSQGNVAAGSLILWTALNNFFNSVNPLIWPRDNLMKWWDGNIWCDINVRIQVGTTVGLAASTIMIVRKLAKVMDTRNITVSRSRNSKIKEKVLEVVWCWGYPLVMVVVYYVVQPIRYALVGIAGCLSSFHSSWPSVVLNFMWGPITMCVAAYYASLLIYRLYRYRREFHRLVAARNTTKSRFVRLFIICTFIILLYLPYTIWLLVRLCAQVKDPYSWSEVHGDMFNTIAKSPVFGKVPIETWVQVGTGYVIFFVFGTGTDAHNLYKKMLLAIGLGRVFPSLYIMSESGSSTPASFITARTWSSNLSKKARSMFLSKTDSATDTFNDSMRNNSVALESVSHLHNVSTEDTLLRQKQQEAKRGATSSEPSFFKRIFDRNGHHSPVLPLFSRRSVTEITNSDSATPSNSPAVHTRAWASETPSSGQSSEQDGVHVIREVHLHHRERDDVDKERKSADVWA